MKAKPNTQLPGPGYPVAIISRSHTLAGSTWKCSDGPHIQGSLVTATDAELRNRHPGFATITGGMVQHGFYFDSGKLTCSGSDLRVEDNGGGNDLATVTPSTVPLASLDHQFIGYQAGPLPAIPSPLTIPEGESFGFRLTADSRELG